MDRGRVRVLTPLGVLVAGLSARADVVPVTFTVTNLQPPNGNALAPMSFLAHNGSFDWFNVGQPGSEAVQRLAEDGENAQLLATASQSPNFGLAGHTPGGPIMPGESRTVTLMLDSANPLHRFFSYGAMFVPSNDAFIANDNPGAFQLFDAGGNLIQRNGATAIIVDGPTGVWDAGTEVNDEIPANLPGIGQVAPNTGPSETDVVRLHPGFMGSVRLGGPLGTILTAHPGADFTAPGALVARITIVPAPATAMLGGLGMLLVTARRRR
jgi:hypothetical protein